MDRVCVAIFLTFTIALPCAYAQSDSAGVFLTASAYRDNKLTLGQSCGEKRGKIKVGRNEVKISLTSGAYRGKYHLKKSALFAVKTCKELYRIQNGLHYKLVNSSYIPLYTRSVEVGAGDGAFYEDKFYFSSLPESEIRALTKAEVEKTFAINKTFLNFVNISFETDRDLGVYNKQLKKYMLIYFYEESLK